VRPAGLGDVALAQAQTAVVTMIVLFQILYLLQSRTRARRVRDIGWTTTPMPVSRLVPPSGLRW
jgi:hypothetical protein